MPLTGSCLELELPHDASLLFVSFRFQEKMLCGHTF